MITVNMQRILKQTLKFCSFEKGSIISSSPFTVSVRWHPKEWQRHFLRDQYNRRLDAGPPQERPRSAWINWNYNSEIYCFGKRLGEDFKEETLRKAFLHRSHIEKEQEDMSAALQDPDQKLIGTLPVEEDNTELVNQGEQVLTNFCKAYLRHHFPRMPEECVCSVYEYLTTDEMLAYVGVRVGIKDLILSAEFPATDNTLTKTFKAVIGALAHDQNKAKAEKFIQDFVMTQLIGKDINELLGIINPMGLLAVILEKQNMPEPEPRLIHASGSSTVLSVYMVGIYCDKQLIGKCYGETAIIAEEMAARDALRNIFETTLHREPLAYKQALNLDPSKYEENYKVPEYFGRPQIYDSGKQYGDSLL